MLKAIQTRYAGYLFRSRLEARWAVFFDALGLKWEHEPEGFELEDGTLYLPDFKLLGPHGIAQWVEVKPTEQSPVVKHDKFAAALTNHLATTVVVRGDPIEHFSIGVRTGRRYGRIGMFCPRCGSLFEDDEAVLQMRPLNGGFFGTYQYPCWPCDETTPSGGGNPTEEGVFGPVVPHKGYVLVGEAKWDEMRARVVNAAIGARSARFEHGQSGATL